MLKIISLGLWEKLSFLQSGSPRRSWSGEVSSPNPLESNGKLPHCLSAGPKRLTFPQLLHLCVQVQRKGEVRTAHRELRVCSFSPILLPKDHFHPTNFFPRYGIICFYYKSLGKREKLFWKFKRNPSQHIYECLSPLPCLWMTRVLLFLLTACWGRFFPFKQSLLLAAGYRGSKSVIDFCLHVWVFH